MKIFLALIFAFVVVSGFGQGSKSNKFSNQENKVKIRGSIQLSHDFYTLRGVEISHLRARRPQNLTRLNTALTFQYRKFNLPIELVLSSQGTSIITPVDQFQAPYALFSQIKSGRDLVNYLSNPINRVGISPNFKGFKLNLGTHTPNFSELVQGNISLFGMGAEYSNSRFFSQLSYGVSQPAVNADSTTGRIGAYQRTQYALRAGIGHVSYNHLAVNISGAKDNIGSVNAPLRGVRAQEGVAVSLQSRFILFKHFSFENEVAGSIVTENLEAYNFDFQSIGVPEPGFITFNLSSRADFAFKSSLNYQNKGVKIGSKVLYVGPGYKSLALPFFQSDRLEITFEPRFSFLKKKWTFSGIIGNRINNLTGTKLAPMNQLIANVNLNGRIGENLNLNLSYGNFGVRNSVINDTFRIENVAQNFQFSPSYNWKHKNSSDLFIVSVAHDRFEDFNVLTGNVGNNQSNVFLFNWLRSFERFPLSLGLSYTNFSFKSTVLKMENQALSVNGGYSFLKKKLKTTISFGRLLNSPDENASNDKQWIGSLGLDFKLPKQFSLGLRYNSNNYIYGSSRPNSRFNEHTLRFNVTKRF